MHNLLLNRVRVVFGRHYHIFLATKIHEYIQWFDWFKFFLTHAFVFWLHIRFHVLVKVVIVKLPLLCLFLEETTYGRFIRSMAKTYDKGNRKSDSATSCGVGRHLQSALQPLPGYPSFLPLHLWRESWWSELKCVQDLKQGLTVQPFHSHMRVKILLCERDFTFRSTCVRVEFPFLN